MELLHLIGRIILGGYFLYNAANHLVMSRAMLTGYAGSQGVPAPGLAVVGSGVLLLLGGLSVLIGYAPAWGIACLILFLVPVSFSIHRFWAVQDPQAKMNEMINFTKNWALVGALLALLAIPEPWPFSL
ncbi:MAG: DoxX family membrane protein [Longimicrobiales bacterium]